MYGIYVYGIFIYLLRNSVGGFNYVFLKKMSICYIVTCYFGKRRVTSPLYGKDNLFFIKQQIKALEHLKHDIDTAIFVFNIDASDIFNRKTSGSELTLLEGAVNLISEAKKVKTKVLFRPNIDFSYGAWNDALKAYAKDFDYSFLIEDDYAPVANNFDKKFIEYIENDPSGKTFYVCQFLWSPGDIDPAQNPKHPTIVDGHCGVSNGVILNSAYIDCGPFRLDNAIKNDYGKGQVNQVRFLMPFTDKKLKIASTHDKYSVKFSNKWDGSESLVPDILTFGPAKGLDLLMPLGVFGVPDAEWKEHGPKYTDGHGNEVSYAQWVLDPR